jgi:hypothetical protein
MLVINVIGEICKNKIKKKRLTIIYLTKTWECFGTFFPYSINLAKFAKLLENFTKFVI